MSAGPRRNPIVEITVAPFILEPNDVVQLTSGKREGRYRVISVKGSRARLRKLRYVAPL